MRRLMFQTFFAGGPLIISAPLWPPFWHPVGYLWVALAPFSVQCSINFILNPPFRPQQYKHAVYACNIYMHAIYACNIYMQQPYHILPQHQQWIPKTYFLSLGYYFNDFSIFLKWHILTFSRLSDGAHDGPQMLKKH